MNVICQSGRNFFMFTNQQVEHVYIQNTWGVFHLGIRNKGCMETNIQINAARRYIDMYTDATFH